MPTNRLKDFNFADRDSAGGPGIVSFISGKGGVGKSILAFNTGAVLASQGRRTLIVDCDYSFGNIHILGNVIPEMTLTDVIRDKNNFDRATVALSDNYSLLASPAAAGSYHELDNLRFRRFMGQLKSLAAGYDYVILDTTSGHLEIIKLAASHSETNLIIINPELTSIADGYGLFKFLIGSKFDFSAHIFLNNIEGESEYEFFYQKFAVMAGKFLGHVPLSAGYLFSDRHVIESVSKQSSLVEIFPDSPAVSQLTSLCKIITANSISGGGVKTIRSEDNINSSKALADIKE